MGLFLCLCLSVTSRSSTKTAKHRITQTTPHDSPGILVSGTKDLREIRPGSPLRGRRMQVGWVKIGDFWKISGYISLTRAVSGLPGRLSETGSRNNWLLVAFNRAQLEQVKNMFNCYNICRCIPMDLFQISVECPTSNVQLAWRTYRLLRQAPVPCIFLPCE